MYVPNYINNTVSVIDSKQDKVVANVAVGDVPSAVDYFPSAVAVDSNTGKVCVTSFGSGTVSVIATGF